MQNDISDLHVGYNDLVKEPGEVGQEADEAFAPWIFTLAIEEQVMAEIGHHQAAEDAQSQVEGVKHPGQDHPKQEQDCECGELGFHFSRRGNSIVRFYPKPELLIVKRQSNTQNATFLIMNVQAWSRESRSICIA
jgi:hypothetical protein